MKIAVVGVCGSGKTTIANELRRLGYDAYVVGQEHSAVHDLWRRQNPDVLVFLDVPLAVVRARRGERWPEWLFHTQRGRLEDAQQSADIYASTATDPVPETVSAIVNRLPAGLSRLDQEPPASSSVETGSET